MPPKTERFEVRFELSMLERIDNWASRQPDRPTRSDALRRLVKRGLETKIDNGDRLVIMMLRDIQKALKLKHTEIDPDFVAEAIWGGHYWALDWQYPGLFHEHFDRREAVHEVVNTLDMWSLIENSYENFSADDKKRVEARVGTSGRNPRFPGFDGNYETEYMSIAQFLVEKMDRFQSFKGRDFNSHHPEVDHSRRMTLELELNARVTRGSTSPQRRPSHQAAESAAARRGVYGRTAQTAAPVDDDGTEPRWLATECFDP